MAENIGRLINLGVARETSRGVGVAPTFWFPRTTFGFNDRVLRLNSSEVHGHIDDSTDSFIAEKFADGSIEGEVKSDGFGLFLYAIMGAVSSGSSSGAYAHTFTTSNTNQHTSLTLGVDGPNVQKQFELAMLNSLTINISPS